MFMIFRSEEGRLWSAVDPKNIIGGASALHWKLGATVHGKWHVVGIVDCSPGNLSWPTATEQLIGAAQSPFADRFVDLMIEISNLIGRPPDCYGITPLVVLRALA